MHVLNVRKPTENQFDNARRLKKQMFLRLFLATGFSFHKRFKNTKLTVPYTQVNYLTDLKRHWPDFVAVICNLHAKSLEQESTKHFCAVEW